MNAEELIAIWSAHGLRFQRGEQRLEPFERAGVLAHPDEFDTAETLWRVRAQTQVVDGLENRRPRRDTNTSTDENRDFILKHVLSGSSIGSVDTESGHLLAVLKSNFVHAHGVELVVKLGLRLTRAKSISKSASEISNLSDVDGNVRIVGARGDCEWVPLVVADFWAVKEQPLAGLVLHARLSELNFDGI